MNNDFNKANLIKVMNDNAGDWWRNLIDFQNTSNMEVLVFKAFYSH